MRELRRWAEVTPAAVSLIEPGGARLTFAGLQERIQRVAYALTGAGISRGDVVALVLPDGAGLITSFLGAASVAGCAVLNPALRRSEIERTLADLQPRALIVDQILDSPAADVARERGISVLNIESCTELTGRTLRELSDSELPDSREVALLLQTSATTGTARIVPLTHSHLRAMATNTSRTLDLTSADRFLSMMPLFHLQGLLSSLAQLLVGGSVVCTAGFDGAAFLPWLEEHRPTWYTAGPTLHHAILPLIEARPDILERSPLRFVRSIGAPLPQALMDQLERALRAPVLEGYGMTEAGAITSNTPRHRKPGSVGRSTGSEIAIMSETGELLAPDSTGEIVVRGEAVMQSYLKDPDANRSAFHLGWLRTGDLGRLDADGFLFVTGRIKEMINRGGEKIVPGEIENCLLAHPAVAEAAAIGVLHPTLGEDVMAAAVLRPGASVSEPELRCFAGQHIADFKVPRRIIFLDAIPKGATGKPAREAIVAEVKAKLETAPGAPAAATAAEKRLADIWQRILKIESVDPRHDFFDLGGDSLALTLMLAEVEFEFGVESRDEFLSTPTIETLAQIVTRSPGPQREKSYIVSLQPRGARIPFFCIPGAGENPYYFLDLARRLGEDQPFYVVRDPRALADRGVYTLEDHASLYAAAIRSKRAEGPYLLGGHCYGGILAFEIARQLKAAGQKVGLVALFEVPTPGYPKVVRHWKKYLRQSAALVYSLARGRKHEVRMQARSHRHALERLLARKKQAVTRRALVSTGLERAIEPAEQLGCRNERAGRAYTPGKLECNVVHFIAADERPSTLVLDDPRLGWRDMVGRGFSTCQVPGKADGIFSAPNVNELAAHLRARLEAANQS